MIDNHTKPHARRSMMKWASSMPRAIAIMFLLYAARAFGQGAYYGDNIVTSSTQVAPGQQAPVFTVPYAQVYVCALPIGVCVSANSVPVYSDAGLTQLKAQPLMADAQGNFGFYVSPGQYYYTATAPGGRGTFTKPLTIAGNGPPGTGSVVNSTGTAQSFQVGYAAGAVTPGATLTASNLQGALNEEVYPGTTVGARVNAAVAACGTGMCTILIPPYAPLGNAWNVPLADNILLYDQRGTLSQPFSFQTQTTTGLRSYQRFTNYRSVDQPFELDDAGTGTFVMDLESRSTGGGTTGKPGRSNNGALLLYADRTAGSRPIWGTDINVQFSNQNNLVTAFEVDVVNNSGAADPGALSQGILDICSSNVPGTNCGTGLTVQGSNSLWKYGMVIEAYSTNGLLIYATAGRNSDIAIVPPADDANIEMTGRNAANTASVWSIDDSGNFNGATFSGKVINASQRGFITPVSFGMTSTGGGLGIMWNLTAGSGETDFVNNGGSGGGGFSWYNSTTSNPGSPILTLNSVGAITAQGSVSATGYSAGGTAGFTGSCPSTTTITVKGGLITGCS